jgi:GTP cyclohydrolase II
MAKKAQRTHIRLTSHPNNHGPKPIAVNWGAPDPSERGPIIATLTNAEQRNAIGTHSGAYAMYRALAVAAGALDPGHVSDLTNTAPWHPIGPHPQWSDPKKIVSLDPFGAVVRQEFSKFYEDGYDILPTIAITKAHLHLPEMRELVAAGGLNPDGDVLTESGECLVTKAAIEPVWYLPGVAERLDVEESELRRTLFEQTGGMFSELVTRNDVKVFLPPIGGMTVYIFGDPGKITDPQAKLTVRVHDECNGSDVFGSDICTCRPYLVLGIKESVLAAQNGGAGVIVYFRKEGRALGEVTKFLVYNARKRQTGGDRAEEYFSRTECVAGVQDMRFQRLMPDVLHWLGVTKIDRFVSMSNMKYDAVVGSGIDIDERVGIPDDLIPFDARVEMDAKRAAGYYSETATPDADELSKPKGREF